VNIWSVVAGLGWVLFCIVAGHLSSRSALLRVRRAILEREDRIKELAVELDRCSSLMERSVVAVDKLQAELDVQRRKSRELFDVVESVLKERDQWKKMWFDHGREHLNAQNQLENGLVQARTWLKNALVSVNAFRKEKGLAPIGFGLDPKDKPVGTAAQFEALLEQSAREAMATVDGLALRDAAMTDSSK